MNIPDRDTLQHLLALSQNKLALLESFAQSLLDLREELFEEDTNSLALHSQRQNGYIEQINRIDKEFSFIVDSFEQGEDSFLTMRDAVPVELQQLNLILKKQQQSLKRISELNENAIEIAQALAAAIKDKIIDINRQKTLVSGYQQEEQNRRGVLLNYKEQQKKRE